METAFKSAENRGAVWDRKRPISDSGGWQALPQPAREVRQAKTPPPKPAGPNLPNRHQSERPTPFQRGAVVLVTGTELPRIAQPHVGTTANLGVQPGFHHRRIAGNRSPRHRERIARVERDPRRWVHVAKGMAPAGAGGESALDVAQHQRLAAAQAERAGGGAVALAGARQRGATAAFLKCTAAQIGPGQARIGFQGEGITRLQRPTQFSEYLRGTGAVIGAQRLIEAADRHTPFAVDVVPGVGPAQQQIELAGAGVKGLAP